MNSCFFLENHGKWGQCLRGKAKDSRGQSELSHLRSERERRGGGRMNRFVVGSSEGIAKTEREGEKALQGLKNAICDGSRKT